MMYIIVLGIIFLGISARWNWWRLPKKGIPILMYHKIGDPPEGSKLKKLWVSEEKFRCQMQYLKSHGYTPVHFRDLYRFWDEGHALPPKPILLTFDDGYKNNFQLGHKILKEFGFKATIFVVTQTVNGDNHWHNPESETRIPMLSWEELAVMQKEGWEIGSHTQHHPRLATLSLEQALNEMKNSRMDLESHLNIRPDTFAYPYGNGEDVMELRQCVEKAGYRIAVGVHSGKWTLDQIKLSPYNLPRVFVRGDETMLDFSLQLSRGKSRF